MLTSLMAGLTFGLSAGLSPGPLSTFVISQTLRHGIREGIRVALSPLITDLPIILISVFVLTQLANANTILGMISLIGGAFVCYIAYETFKTTHFEVNQQAPAPQSLLRGTLVNALSPHPYLFWFSVGAPTMVKAMQVDGWPAALAFVLGFYLTLIGSKVGVAVLRQVAGVADGAGVCMDHAWARGVADHLCAAALPRRPAPARCCFLSTDNR